MSFSSFISSRLSLRDGNRRNRPPAIVVAVCGIAVSFTVMMLSIAVVKGFKNEIRHKIMGFDSQITVVPLAGYYGSEGQAVRLDDELRHELSAAIIDAQGVIMWNLVPGRIRVWPLTASYPGILKTSDDFLGVLLRGYGDGHDDSFERSILVEGELPDNADSRGITVSEVMAGKLNLKPGDRIDAYFITPEGVRPRKFDIRGIYRSDFGEYDNMVVFAPFGALARLSGYEKVRGLRLRFRGLLRKASFLLPVRCRGASMMRLLRDVFRKAWRLQRSILPELYISTG